MTKMFIRFGKTKKMGDHNTSLQFDYSAQPIYWCNSLRVYYHVQARVQKNHLKIFCFTVYYFNFRPLMLIVRNLPFIREGK